MGEVLVLSARSFVALIKRFPATYWILWLATFCSRLGRFVLPFLAVHLAKQGVSEGRIGGIIAAFGLGAFVAAPIGGYVADQRGRRAATLLGLTGSAVTLMLFPWVGQAWFAAGAFAMGFTGDFCRPGIAAIIADVVPEEDRDAAYATQYWAFNLAFAVSPLIAGALASRDTVWLFVGDALGTLVCAGIVAVGVRETRPSVVVSVTDHARLSGAQRQMGWVRGVAWLRTRVLGSQSPYSNPHMMVFVALAIVIESVFLQMISSLPVTIGHQGMDAATYGHIIAVNGLMVVVFQPVLAHLLHDVARIPVMVAGCLLVGLGFGAHAFVDTPLAYAFCVAVWSLGEIAFFPVASAYVAALAPQQLIGSYQGAFQMSWGAAQLLAPWLGMAVLEQHGARVLWLGCAGVVGSAVAGFVGVSKVLPSADGARGLCRTCCVVRARTQ